MPGGVTLTLTPINPNPAQQEVYSVKNFHGDTAITAGPDGTPTSSVFLYEPFGQQSQSATFGTGSNPQNSSTEPMGWAADPTRKQESVFTLAVIQMGARVKPQVEKLKRRLGQYLKIVFLGRESFPR